MQVSVQSHFRQRIDTRATFYTISQGTHPSVCIDRLRNLQFYLKTPRGAVQVLGSFKGRAIERDSRIYCGAESYPPPSYKIMLGTEKGAQNVEARKFFRYASTGNKLIAWAAFSAQLILLPTSGNLTCKATERNYTEFLSIPSTRVL